MMPQKRVVAEIITDLSIGGAEIMLCSLLSRLDRDRFQPFVITFLDGCLRQEIESQSIPVFLIRARRRSVGIKPLRDLARLIRELQPDLIHGWMYHGSLAAFLSRLFLFRKIPLIWSIHSSTHLLSRKNKLTAMIIKLEAFLSYFPSAIHYVSPAIAQQHEALGFSRKKTVVIPNAIDTERFVPSEQSRTIIRELLNLPSDIILIGLIGSYRPIKDHATYLQAASLLIKRHPDVHFILAGSGINWNNEILRETIIRLKLTNNIHLLGQRSDIPLITAGLDIACSTSLAESFSLSVAEAMSCGVACVATEGANPILIKSGCGLVVSQKNPQELEAAWHDLIERGDEGRRELGKNARQRIERDFSLHKVIQSYEKLYDKVLA